MKNQAPAPTKTSENEFAVSTSSDRKRPGKITVNPHLDSSYKRSSDGKSKFSIRVLIRGKKKYYPIGKMEEEMLFILPKYWVNVEDPETGKVLRKKRIVHAQKNTNSQSLERRLFAEVEKMERLLKQIQDSGLNISHELLKTRWEKWSSKTFSMYCKTFAETTNFQMSQKVIFSGIAKDIAAFDEARGWITSVSDVTFEWLVEYRYWLKNEKPIRRGKNNQACRIGIKDSTIYRQMVQTGRVIKAAHKEGLIPGLNPYLEYVEKELRSPKISRREKFLSPEEVEVLFEAYKSGKVLKATKISVDGRVILVGPKYQEVLQQFLASIYTGFRYSDLKAWANGDCHCKVDHKAITIKTKKTGITVRVKISKRLSEVVNFSGEGPIFLGKVLSSSAINKKLCEVLQYLGIDKSITWHGSRHTFATMLLNNDVSIKTVSTLLGHSSVGITELYAKVIDKSMDRAIDTLDSMGPAKINESNKGVLEKVAMMIGMNASKGLVIPKEITQLLEQLADAPENERRVGIVVDMTA